MHADQDEKVDTVLLLTIGNIVLFAIDDAAKCARIAACELALKSTTPHDKDAQKVARQAAWVYMRCLPGVGRV
jgi:hypothetical protein